MTFPEVALVVAACFGWWVRGFVNGWIVRHMVSRATRAAINADIDKTAARWFHRPADNSQAG